MARVQMRKDTFVNGAVSRVPGVKRSVDREAKAIGRRAEARLASHRAQGFAKIEVRTGLPGKYGDIDAEVDLVDNGKHIAAAAIEFGHEQVVFGRRTGKFTPGLYIVTGAAGLA